MGLSWVLGTLSSLSNALGSHIMLPWEEAARKTVTSKHRCSPRTQPSLRKPAVCWMTAPDSSIGLPECTGLPPRARRLVLPQQTLEEPLSPEAEERGGSEWHLEADTPVTMQN